MTGKQTQVYFFAAVLLAVLVLNAVMFLPFIGAIVAALTLSVIFGPVYKKVLAIIGGNKPSLAALFCVFLVLLVIIIPLISFSTLVFREASSFYSFLRGGGSHALIDKLNYSVNSKLDVFAPGVSVDFGIYLERILSLVVSNVGSVFLGISSVAFSLFLALLAFYYLLKDGERLKRVVMSLSPLPDSYDKDIFNKLSITVSSVVKGSLLVALIQGILSGVGFFIFGVPSPAMWGAVAVLSALIPMIGTTLVLVPAVIYLLTVGSINAAIGLAIWGVLVVGSVDNLLRQKLFERGINIHSFFILISVLGGLEFFGPVGFLLGPLLLSLLFALLDIYKKGFKEDAEQNS